MTTDAKVYRKYAKDYLASSSIRGIPRVIKAKTFLSRLTWALVLIVLTVIGVAQLTEVVMEYLKYETTQDSRQERNISSPFPSITVCNLQPLNSEANNGINVMDRHIKMIEKIETGYGKAYFKSLYSMTALFQNSKRTEIEQVSHPINNLIRHCAIQYFYEGELKTVECNLGDSSRFPHPDYFNCYTFHPKVAQKHEPHKEHPSTNHSETIFIRSVKMIVYLDDFLFPLLPENFDDTSSVRHGVRLVVHPHRSYPDIDNAGVEVSPGLSTTFRLDTTYRYFLPKPYGSCFNEDAPDLPASDPAADKGKLLEYMYTRDVCRRMCLQHRIIRKCSCLDPSLPIPPGIIVFEDTFRNTLSMARRRKRSAEDTQPPLDEPQQGPSQSNQHFVNRHETYPTNNESVLLPYCLKWIYTEDPNEGVESFLNRQRCWQETKEQLDAVTGCETFTCGHTCSSVHYDYKITRSRWPHETFHLGLYKKYIKNHLTISKYFTFYDEVDKVAQTNLTKAYAMLIDSKLIDRNFVELQFIRTSDKVTIVKDIQQFTLSRLCSSIGGALNLWTGVTIIALVEGMELICTLFGMLFQSKRQFRKLHNESTKLVNNEDTSNQNSSTSGKDNLASS